MGVVEFGYRELEDLGLEAGNWKVGKLHTSGAFDCWPPVVEIF